MKIDSYVRHEVVNNKKHPIVVTEATDVLGNLANIDRLSLAWGLAWHIARAHGEHWACAEGGPVPSEAEAWKRYANVSHGGKSPTRALYRWVSDPGVLILGDSLSSQLCITFRANSPGQVVFKVINRGGMHDLYFVGEALLIAGALALSESPYVIAIGDKIGEMIEEAFAGASRRFDDLAEHAATQPPVHDIAKFREWGDRLEPLFGKIVDWGSRNGHAVRHPELEAEAKRLSDANKALDSFRTRGGASKGAPVEPEVKS